jgi:hypothetical protein
MDGEIPVFIAHEERQRRTPGIGGKLWSTFHGMPIIQVAAFTAGVCLAKERACSDSVHFGF